MLWGAILLGLMGAFIGLRFRAPALIPATGVALAWALLDGWLRDQSAGRVALAVIVLTFVLHLAYLAGLALRTLARR